jgi:stress response protein YsnF
VPLSEEQLVAGTRPQEVGRVQLRKGVQEEQQSIDVPVTQEQVRVREMVTSGGEPGPDAFQE